MNVGDTRDLFKAWQDAERCGDEETSFDLLMELVARLQEEWSQGGPPLGRRHLHLLNLLGLKLRTRDLHEAALAVYGAAREGAAEQQDLYGVRYFSCQAVQSCVALFDFRSAAEVLSSVLGTGSPDALDDPETSLGAVAALTAPGAETPDVHLLRVEAALALGRYLAARGRLGTASAVYEHALALLAEQESPTVSTEDVRIRLAEVRLDRGDFAAVEKLLSVGKPSGQPARIEWCILEAGLRHLQGRFSEADEFLVEILRQQGGLRPAALSPLMRAAMWQRIHVLGALNRLDEAEEMVAGLADGEGADDPDLGMVRALLDARRMVATVALHLPPDSHELLVPSASGGVPEALPEDPQAVLEAFRHRTRERVRDEYGRFWNHVLLELHHGRQDLALLLCAELACWTDEIDSRFIAARQEHLWALVYHYGNDLPTAQEHAENALHNYASLGTLGDQWTMRRVLGWSLRRGGASPERVEHNHEQMVRLQDQLLGQLSPADQALYSLNKWSTVDEEVSAVCRRAHKKIGETNGFLSDFRRRRLALRALRDLQQRRRLQSAGRGVRELPGTGTDGPRDVYRLALENVRRRLTKGDGPALAKRLAPRWLPDDTALAHYVVLPDRVELFLVTRQGCELVPLTRTPTRPHLWEMTETTLRQLKRRRKRWDPKMAQHRVRDAAGRLERIDDLAVVLGLPEIAKRLPSRVKHLAIVPDDILAHVPFAALPVDGRPLVERFSVVLLPSLTWVRRCPRQPLSRSARSLGVAVTSSNADKTYEDLVDAADELGTAQEAWPAEWTTLVDEAARHERVREELGRAEVAHFACHGDFFPERPDDSGLLLRDAWLKVREAYGLDLGSLALAVLASCWGANATVLPGGIHVGLPFALLDAGARAAVASLWKVPDAANKDIVSRLYSKLGELGPIEAVAEAQRHSVAKEPAAHWAGYVAYAGGVAPRWPWRLLLGLS